ncbi:hypothetical protein INT48_009451 [Thamnidium elegans]|uniref:Uncharacterized protein n=1 Tax=Thamnidium elegans TaxID=101142 RepID=A0A8H7VW86_9FUNG|nr:hypothetical protein INT48_009451 [Thamnidium elegans]
MAKLFCYNYQIKQHYPVIDNNVYSTPQQYQRLQSPLYPTLPSQRKEPLPSATDGKPNITLSITEIAEFSSTMVYLMWHARRQSVMDLHSSSKVDCVQQNNNNLEQTRVTADMANMTSAAFKKFSMLLQNNPNIQGADGSEYRLFTVALMLANKFLDDNTFTNKTWSEVSGMKVTDLNIMELEFLDVLRFKLSIQKEEYERWRTALFGFRGQLMGVPVEIQRQKLMETMALSTQPWLQPTMQQQHASHNFYLFSKAQQQFPVQPTFNGPLARVPLRIPSHPVYSTLYDTSPNNVQHRYSSSGPNRRPAENTGYAPYQKQQPSPFTTPIANQQPFATGTRASHRTSSLPQSGGLDLTVKNSSYYYATPSSTPTNNNVYQPHIQLSFPSTTSYYVDTPANPTTTTQSPADYNPYVANTNNISDIYNRSTVPRSTSYKNVPVTPNGHYMYSQQVYNNGPTMEDPLTAIDSYRTNNHHH